MTRLHVLSAGPGVTVQDGGRHGSLRFGVTVAGPMDPIAFALANRMVGNPAGAGAIEISLGGFEATAEDGVLDVAVVAPGFDVRLDGAVLPDACVVRLEPGARLAIRPGPAGAWACLAPAGRLDLAPVLGSLSTHTRSGLGGLDGRALRSGDRIGVADPRETIAGTMRLLDPPTPDEGDIRVVLGPQADHFAPDQIAAFLERDWTVSPRSDRMAYALDGEPLTHARGHDIVSDGVAHGAVQVPGSGLPFVLMADRQPTGGYPKIATVIGADLGRMAQRRPGARVRFRAVTIEEAVAARRRIAEAAARRPAMEPLVRGTFTSEFLLSRNLISSWGA
jgi:biotin-dependent carboxylase-like uncharacterized protein